MTSNDLKMLPREIREISFRFPAEEIGGRIMCGGENPYYTKEHYEEHIGAYKVHGGNMVYVPLSGDPRIVPVEAYIEVLIRTEGMAGLGRDYYGELHEMMKEAGYNESETLTVPEYSVGLTLIERINPLAVAKRREIMSEYYKRLEVNPEEKLPQIPSEVENRFMLAPWKSHEDLEGMLPKIGEYNTNGPYTSVIGSDALYVVAVGPDIEEIVKNAGFRKNPNIFVPYSTIEGTSVSADCVFPKEYFRE